MVYLATWEIYKKQVTIDPGWYILKKLHKK